MKNKSAHKKIGVLLRSPIDSSNVFRIYSDDGEFKDYKLLHEDLRVQILDESAELVEAVNKGEEGALVSKS